MSEVKFSLFVLLLGPSGTGKSSIIRALQSIDDKIVFVSPITDRPQRVNETEKVSVDADTFSELERQKMFLLVNHLYGYRYGTPRTTIDDIIRDGKIPILDFPLSKIDKLNIYQSILYTIYIVPPSLGELKDRLKQSGRLNEGSGFEEAKLELSRLARVHFTHPDIDDVVINRNLEDTVQCVYSLIQTKVKGN